MISPDKSKQTEKRSKKILFVSPDMGGISAYRQYHAPPLGVVRIAGYLNEVLPYDTVFVLIGFITILPLGLLILIKPKDL